MTIYIQKDLGYQRTPTSAILRVEMPDGKKWDVPVQAVVDSRDEHYRDDEEDTIGSIRDGGLTDYDIYEWAAGNMNWSDVKEFAVIAPDAAPKKVDWEDGWCNGNKEIVGTI